MFAGNYAPAGWSFCDGQFLLVAQNPTLFGLIGTDFGGDGATTFRLPDMRGRMPVHRGSKFGMIPRSVGDSGGAEEASITAASQLPAHSHELQASAAIANDQSPGGKTYASTNGVQVYIVDNDSPEPYATGIVSSTGGGATHDNLQPFLCIHFIIALTGAAP